MAAATYVYVISGDHGRQKIGSSDNPARRIRELQTGSPYKLRFEFVGETDDRAGGAIEVEAHFMLNAHKSPGGDEWFTVPPDVALTAVMAAARRLGYACRPVDPTALSTPQAFAIDRPAWHKWIRIAMGVVALLWALPTLLRYGRGEIDAGYLIGAAIAIMAATLVARWALIKCVEALIAFDRKMHPDDGVKAPLSLD